jgi:DnaJ-class molecular chaperone
MGLNPVFILQMFHSFFVLGDIKGIEGEGMPHYRNPFERGNLYIKFDVTFPESHFANEVKLKVWFLYSLLSLANEYLSQHHLLKHS